MKKINLLLILFLFISCSNLMAETEIKAEADKQMLAPGEMLTYKVIVASSEKELPEPRFPEFAGFEVVSQARSSTVSFLREGAKSILVYIFILVPIESGSIEIPPSTIKVKGKEYSSPSFEIEVTSKEEKSDSREVEEPPFMPQFPDQTDQLRVDL